MIAFLTDMNRQVIGHLGEKKTAGPDHVGQGPLW